jgi:hypothetical protein
VWLVFFGLLFLYKVTVALGIVSLILTVLGGTDIVKKYFQYLQLPITKNETDVWTACSVAVAFTGTVAGVFKDEFTKFEGISYLVIIAILITIMYCSAKQNREAQNKAP